MKYVAYLFLIFVGVAVLGIGGIALRGVLLPVRVIDRTIGTTEGIIDKTLTADNAIYNYEWFKQQDEDITAIKAKISYAMTAVDNFNELAGPRKDWTFEDKTEAARLASVKQGLQSQLSDMIATYNARAKMANRNIFLDGKIPAIINVGSYWLK